MERKRITQRYPWLLPIRKKQRCACFYGKMLIDGRTYAMRKKNDWYSNTLFSDKSLMINEETGFPLEYQYNKVHNLKLAAAMVSGIVIGPGETFSFWKLVRHAEKKGSYKDGLTVVDGVLTTEKGGGLCQLSNLLFWLFLHSPLSITERHPHRKRDFPMPKGGGQEGTDAAISEGWMDLKVKNETKEFYHIMIDFDEEYMHGALLCSSKPEYEYEVITRNVRYVMNGKRLFENCFVFRQEKDSDGQAIDDKCLYANTCELGYKPEGCSFEEDFISEGSRKGGEDGRE